MLSELLQDFRYGFRQLLKARGFAAIAILTIAIGIGSVTALFSVVNTVLLQPLAYENSRRIVQIGETIAGQENPRFRLSGGFYFDLLEQSTVFEAVTAIAYESVGIAHGDNVMRAFSQNVAANASDVYSMDVVLGRNFRADEAEAGASPVVLLSVDLWETDFGGATDIIDQQIMVNEESYTVIGVVDDPENTFRFIVRPATHESLRGDYENPSIFVSAMRKKGVSLAQVRSELDVIANRIALAHPATFEGHGLEATPLIDLYTSNARDQLLILLGVVGFLLLIACVNVASLLLARASSRQKELAVRGALGASRGRIVRQLLSESVLISLLGGTLGVLLAYATMGALSDFAAGVVPRTQEGVSIDTTVLSVACGLMLLAGLSFGLIPALQASKGNVGHALNDTGRGSTGSGRQNSVRNTLVIVEIALALMLLTGTGLLLRSLYEMQTFDQGIRTLNVEGNQFDLEPASRYDSPEKILNFTDEVLQRIAGLPDIESVAMTTALPMGNRNRVRSRAFSIDGDTSVPAEERLSADYYTVTPDYFDVMSIPLIRGRGITDADVPGGSPVVVVNREMVERHFPDQDPIGQRIMLFSGSDEPNVWYEIVGIVGNVKPRGPASPTDPQFYTPFVQAPQAHMTIMLRTKGSAPAISQTVTNIFNKLSPDTAFTQTYDFEATISYSWRRQRFIMNLFSIFSVLALVLATIGIYGVMSYTVNQRTQEIGIRMALGALPNSAMRLILRNGSRIILFGILLGATGSLAGSRLLESFLFNISPYDPVTFIGIAAILATVALLACYLPARRATKVDPMVALRAE